MKNLQLELIEILQELTDSKAENINSLYFLFRQKYNDLDKRDSLILRTVTFDNGKKTNNVLLKYIIKKLKNLRNQS